VVIAVVVMCRASQSVRKVEVSRRSIVCNLQEYSLMDARPILQKVPTSKLSFTICMRIHSYT
jgi:hypothetical protein